MRIIAIALSALLGLELGIRLLVEALWFSEVDYLSVLWRRMAVQGGVGGVAFLMSLAIFQAHLAHLAAQAAPLSPRRRLPLAGLLAIVTCLGGSLGWITWIYLRQGAPPLKPWLTLTAETALLPTVLAQGAGWPAGAIAAVLAVLLLVLLRVRTWLHVMSWGLSVCFALLLAGHWTQFWELAAGVPFERTEPLFNRDLGFYVFQLPVWELMQSWLLGLSVSVVLLLSVGYLLARDNFSQGWFPGFTAAQLRHLYVAIGAVLLCLSGGHAISRFKLLYSQRGATYGASFTDITLQLPLETICALVAASIALWLWLRAGFGGQNTTLRSRLNPQRRQLPWAGTPLLALGFYAIALAANSIAPTAWQVLQVEPNELALEEPFIARSIEYTRAAFGLDAIEVTDFEPQENLTTESLAASEPTLENVRLWDSRPLLQTNRQLQQIRSYYNFADADVDRYTIRTDNRDPDAKSKRQQVLIAPRELDYDAVLPEAQTWVNRHLTYTHGYGFTLSPVNEVNAEGLPKYFVQDIGTGENNGAGNLRAASPEIRDSIPIGEPRIYYGELTKNYAIVRTQQPEYDFPSGTDEDTFNTNIYGGRGGISIGGPWRRRIFAWYLRDWRMLLADNFTPQTTLLMRRTIVDRARAIAPFLRYDTDPYLVAANTDDGESSYLHWIVDAYTVSDRYPYSNPGEYPFNYIRNSVKVTIDAYSGETQFYVADSKDPIIQTWQRVFPGLFQPLDRMHPSLHSHIRYPVNLFQSQAERLLTYHMTDPQVFYSREDQWQIPSEIYGDRIQPVEPYHLTMPLSPDDEEEFVLFLPFTPARRENAIAALVARSDGRHYGKQLLYQFPKQELVYGPRQIESFIEGDAEISQRLGLWNRGDARVIKGNLLIIPIQESLLYVEPIYLEAERDGLPKLPRLGRIIVVYGNNPPIAAIAPTFRGALQAIFEPGSEREPAILRQFSLDDVAPNPSVNDIDPSEPFAEPLELE